MTGKLAIEVTFELDDQEMTVEEARELGEQIVAFVPDLGITYAGTSVVEVEGFTKRTVG
jgi:hypothetical protein